MGHMLLQLCLCDIQNHSFLKVNDRDVDVTLLSFGAFDDTFLLSMRTYALRD